MHSTLSVRDIQEPRIHTYINAPSRMHLADPDSKMLKKRTWEGVGKKGDDSILKERKKKLSDCQGNPWMYTRKHGKGSGWGESSITYDKTES